MIANAGSTPSLLIEFFDKTGLRYAPASFSYQIIDTASGTQVRAPTTLQPDKSISIDFAAADTAYLGSGTSNQTRRVLWIADANLPQQETGDFFFDVRRMS